MKSVTSVIFVNGTALGMPTMQVTSVAIAVVLDEVSSRLADDVVVR